MTSFFAALSRLLRRWLGFYRAVDSPVGNRHVDSSKREYSSPQTSQSSAPSLDPSTVSAELRQLVYQASCDMPKPRMHAGQFGSRLRRIDPSFSYEKYGFTKLIYLLEAVPDMVELEKVSNPGAAPAYYVRCVLGVQPLLLDVLENFDSEDGWVHQDSILSAMTRQVSTFSVHTYGFGSIASFLQHHTHLLDFNPVEDSYVRLRQPSAAMRRVPQKRFAQARSPQRDHPSPSAEHERSTNGSTRRPGLSYKTVADTAPASDTLVRPFAVEQTLSQRSVAQQRDPSGRQLSVVHLSKFAGLSPQVLNQKVNELAAIALPERWYFGPQPPADFAYPILKSYLRYTFIRLQHESKVLESTNSQSNQQYRAFNTGLLDNLLRPIYALLSASSPSSWGLTFCIPGEGVAGKTLSANFATLPLAANYLQDPAKIFYYLAAGTPEVDWHHIIKDNMERLPSAFLARYAPANFTHRNTDTLSGSEFHAYKKAFAAALDADPAAYRSIVNRLKEALSRTLLKTQLNYKTAVPTYYPNINSIDLLLPICLVKEDVADCAIVVRRADSGKYIGHTILTLRQAYNNARLICKLDEHWLTRAMILSGNVPGNVLESALSEASPMAGETLE